MNKKQSKTRNNEISAELLADLQYVLSRSYGLELSSRIKSGLAAARASGVRLGRPPKKKHGAVTKTS